jgi:hypothetical protein
VKDEQAPGQSVTRCHRSPRGAAGAEAMADERKCELCPGPPLRGERYCKVCRRRMMNRMWAEGYLQRPARQEPYREAEKRENTYETRHGG